MLQFLEHKLLQSYFFNKDLLLSSCNKIEEMKLMNNFCKLLEFETNYK